ncbi:MAG: HEAT repeat domain-containing protein [Acidobacteria bacterium]|nr:HEAT repeat domain-containing protein [Acidobacteriota bacterium]
MTKTGQPRDMPVFFKRIATALLIVASLSATPLAGQQVSRKPFGDSLSRYHQERRRTYDLEHILLNLTLDERQKTVSGSTTLTLRPLNPGLEAVEIDSAELKIRSITQPDGSHLNWQENDGKLHIHLPAPADPSDTITLTIAFDGKPRKGLYFIGPDAADDAAYPDKPVQIWSQGEVEDSHYWFPIYDYPNDKATSEGYYTVNADYMVISNGRLIGVEEHPAERTKTYHWKQEVPHSTYLTSVVVGKFEKYVERAGDLPVEYYVPPGTGRERALRSFRETPHAIRFFSEKIGIPYPYPKYAQVAVRDFVFGGMENISATTLTDRTLHDDSSEPQINSVDLVTHELAHQWFGDLLTCANWDHIWLNEGFATYWADLYREYRFGEQEYRYSLFKAEARYLEEDRQRYRRPMVTSYYTDPLDLFDRTTYEKGALVLDMLRYVLDDEKFFATMTHYAKAHQAGNVTTDDLRKAAEEVSGRDMGWFFTQWTTKAGYPELEITQQWNESTRTVHLVVEQKQLLDEQTPLFRMPVDVEFITSAGRSRRRIEFAHPRDEFDFPLDSQPLITRFDPEHRILATMRFPKTVAELIYQLKNDPSVVGRVWAIDQLVQTEKSGEIVPALRQTLVGDSFWGVREAAAKGLAEIKTVAAREALAEALHDRDARVRQASIRALGSFRKDGKAAKIAAAALNKDRNTFVAAEAALAIGKIQAKDAKKMLRQAVNRSSDQDVVRRFSLRGLGELGDKKEWDTVVPWITYSKYPETRMAAVDALLKLGDHQDSRTAAKLIALVDDPDFYVKQYAIYALAEGNFQQGRAVLIKSAQTALDSRVRRSARIALERLAPSRAPEPISDADTTELRLPRVPMPQVPFAAAP